MTWKIWGLVCSRVGVLKFSLSVENCVNAKISPREVENDNPPKRPQNQFYFKIGFHVLETVFFRHETNSCILSKRERWELREQGVLPTQISAAPVDLLWSTHLDQLWWWTRRRRRWRNHGTSHSDLQGWCAQTSQRIVYMYRIYRYMVPSPLPPKKKLFAFKTTPLRHECFCWGCRGPFGVCMQKFVWSLCNSGTLMGLWLLCQHDSILTELSYFTPNEGDSLWLPYSRWFCSFICFGEVLLLDPESITRHEFSMSYPIFITPSPTPSICHPKGIIQPHSNGTWSPVAGPCTAVLCVQTVQCHRYFGSTSAVSRPSGSYLHVSLMDHATCMAFMDPLMIYTWHVQC